MNERPKSLWEFEQPLSFHQTPIGDYYLPDITTGVIVNEMKKGKIYDPEVVKVAKQYITKGSTVLDVGACFGQMSLIFSKWVGEEGEVISLEANDFLFHILQQNILTNGCHNIRALCRAAYDKNDTTMYRPTPDFVRFDSFGSYGLAPNAKSGKQVSTLTIDSLAIHKPISFMKVDAQGSDLFVLQGAKEAIRRHQMPIIFEFQEEFQAEFGTSFQDYLSFIDSISYKVKKRIDNANYLIVPKSWAYSLDELKVDLEPFKTKIKNRIQRELQTFFKKSFLFWQRCGFHITPNHYFQPIPDTRALPDGLWQRQSELIGIDLNERGQIQRLSQFASQFKQEYEKFPRDRPAIPHKFYLNNFSFESVDAEILYCMIRHFKPNKIIEIGSGFSTTLMAQAILKNKEEGCELIAIDPYPNETIKAGFPGLSQWISKKVQEVPLPAFMELEENDILFIDSSHVLKIGGDVQYIYLEILPRLQKGVLVHFHDIFLPAEYLKKWVLEDYLFWNEQYLLQAFLGFNNHFEVLWAGSYMHLKHPDKLDSAFDSYKREKDWPGSFWILKTK